jgi:hypothetical protein
MSTKVGYLAGDTPFAQRMVTLPANTFVTVRDPSTAHEVKLQVVTAEVLHRLKRFGPNDWRESGDEWPTLLCVSGDKSWSTTDVMIAIIAGNQYLFKVRAPLGTEGATKVAPYAQKFDHDFNREPGSVSMPYKGNDFKLQAIGKWQVTAQTGESHFPKSDQTRFIVAHGKDGVAILVEDDEEHGSQYDSVWEGWICNLNTVVRDVLTPNGE